MINKTINSYQTIIKSLLTKAYGAIRPDIANDWQQQFSNHKAKERIQLLLQNSNYKINSKHKILEIGCGFGYTLYYLSQRYRCQAHGIEPNSQIIRLAARIYKQTAESRNIKLIKAYGEKLPLKKNTYDLVMSFQVVEHVKDPKRVFSECLRVLKPGGYMYHVIPNYYSFWEGHYGSLWLPNLLKNRPLARWYVKCLLKSKAPEFLNELQNITPHYLKEIFKTFSNLEVITYGENIFKKRLTDQKYKPIWGLTHKLIGLKTVLQKIGINELIANVFIIYNWYYPIVIIAKKTR